MDIIYSTGFKIPFLCGTFQDERGKKRWGWLIWGLRIVQMILAIASVGLIFLVHSKLDTQIPRFGLTKDNKTQTIGTFIGFKNARSWMGLMGLATLLTISGVVPFLIGMLVKDKGMWEVANALYYFIISHFIMYATVVGPHPYLHRQWAQIQTPPSNVTRPAQFHWESQLYRILPSDFRVMIWLASAACILCSTVHFLSAIFSPPCPEEMRQLRSQGTSLEKAGDGEGKVDPTDSGVSGEGGAAASATGTTATTSTLESGAETPVPES